MKGEGGGESRQLNDSCFSDSSFLDWVKESQRERRRRRGGGHDSSMEEGKGAHSQP